MHRHLFLASFLLLVASGLIFWQQNRSLKPLGITPSITGQVEYCITCHADLPEISPSHPVETFGCVLCHGGEPLALECRPGTQQHAGWCQPIRLERGGGFVWR